MKKNTFIIFAFVCGVSFAGSVTDRDGNVYKTVQIADQVWMAENMNVAVEGSICYDNDPANCKKYGRLYTWAAAQKACPSGWHLPSQGEFETLLEEVGSSKDKRGANLRVSSWNYGLDKHGFSALPAGYYGSYLKEFLNLGHGALFWSSREYLGSSAYYLRIYDGGAYVDTYGKDYGYSVRCLKDN